MAGSRSFWASSGSRSLMSSVESGIRLTRDSWPDDRRDLKCRKARPQRPRLQMSEALMLQSVPPYVDTRGVFDVGKQNGNDLAFTLKAGLAGQNFFSEIREDV